MSVSPSMLFIMLGCAFLLIGIVGGGIVFREVTIPQVGPVPRAAAIATGIVLLFMGLRLQGPAVDSADAAIKAQTEKVQSKDEELSDLHAEVAKLKQNAQEREQALAREGKQDPDGAAVDKSRQELEALKNQIAALTQRQDQAREQKARDEQVLAKQNDARTASTKVVRDYYDELNRHEVAAARSRWSNPPKGFDSLAKSIQWFKINDVKTEGLAQDGSFAEVYADVVGKRVDESDPQRWQGRVTVSNVDDSWKITKMNLNRIP